MIQRPTHTEDLPSMLRRSLLMSVAAVASLAASALAVPAGAASAATAGSLPQDCAVPTVPGGATCDILKLASMRPGAAPHAEAVHRTKSGATILGYSPANLHAAYHLPTGKGAGQTVALVDAYNDPTAAADLAAYRSQWGLSACTTATGCLRIVGESGSATTLPATNTGWDEEISLDLDMVSAICPNCKILLVEANSSSMTDLGTSVDEAVTLGANVVSNSYGGGESFLDGFFDAAYYNHPGVAITASTGDSGYGVEYPASSPDVVAVGGTTLTQTATGWSQTAWSGAGSGCSTAASRPAWQSSVANISSTCSHRAVADVSADADPNTGVAVYDTSVPAGTTPGWLVFGGTSVASPIVAATFGLAANAATAGGNASYIYAHATAKDLTDVSSGANSSSCSTDLCKAGAGWDGPTGLGTPYGIAAF